MKVAALAAAGLWLIGLAHADASAPAGAGWHDRCGARLLRARDLAGVQDPTLFLARVQRMSDGLVLRGERFSLRIRDDAASRPAGWRYASYAYADAGGVHWRPGAGRRADLEVEGKDGLAPHALAHMQRTAEECLAMRPAP